MAWLAAANAMLTSTLWTSERKQQFTKRHAVMCLRLGIVLGAISIIPNENRRLGFVTHEDDSEFTADGAKNKALTCLAGYAALVAIDAPNAASGCDGDFDDAQEALERWQLGSVDEWKGRTIEMMRRPENVKAVELLASKLLPHGRLEGQYVEALAEFADGNATEAELARFELMIGIRPSGDAAT